MFRLQPADLAEIDKWADCQPEFVDTPSGNSAIDKARPYREGDAVRPATISAVEIASRK